MNNDDDKQISFARKVLSECKEHWIQLRRNRETWDSTDLKSIHTVAVSLREMHASWTEAMALLCQFITPPYNVVNPAEKYAHRADYLGWLSDEVEAWQGLLPSLRKAADGSPHAMRCCLAILRIVQELHAEALKLKPPLVDPIWSDYLQHHPPKPSSPDSE